MPQKYDAIIIGGGHNGLVTAAYLGRAGRKTLVLERRELVGGCAVTEEIWPGFRVSTAAYLTSLLQERIVRELDLPRFGYRVDAKDPAFFSPFPDGRCFFMWQDGRKTLEEIAKFSKRDAEVYPAFEAQLERLSQVVESLLLTTPPQFPPRGIGDLIEYLKLAGRLRKLAPADMVALVKIFTQSAAELLDEWFESPELKVTLATDGVIGANGGPRSQGTAYILMHHVHGQRGRAPRTVGVRARRHGRGLRGHRGCRAQPRRGDPDQCCRSKRSWCADGRARGVVLEGGEEIEGAVVASNLDPRVTFLRLLDERDLPPDFVTSIRRFRTEGTSCKINLALVGPAGIHRHARRARSAASRDHAHLPVHRLHRARLG